MAQQVQMAHLRDQGIDFAVFGADAPSRTRQDRADLLAQLTGIARLQGLKIDKSALAYRRGSSWEFFGTPDLVRYLTGLPGIQWTHKVSVP